MMETNVHFTSSGYRLEGRLQGDSPRAAVITHPHSLYGGNMHNPVVETIARSFHQRGYTTLRFNFRGVEGSQGSYDEGRGEQEDVRQAISYLQKQGFGPIELSGYSFGAWVNAHYAAESLPTMRMSMVSPPTAFMDFRGIQHLPGLTFVLTGSRDDIAPPEMLQRLVPIWNPAASLEVVPGADHFFAVHLEALGNALLDALNALPTFAPDA
jgi:alpha/beta superfamily hydrolase